jgi:protein-S-isoprenylcysteine O-methyltransferase Ste14
MNTLGWVFFFLGSAGLVFVSRRSLLNVRAHGFYRFFAWELLLALFLRNVNGWFAEPLAWHQLISWFLLIASIPLVLIGVGALRTTGRSASRDDPALLGLEKTSHLVTAGLYRYIRHPMYSSLLCLGWGLFFKSPSWIDAGLALLVTFFLYATARIEEREDSAYFGAEYLEYMRHSKMFIPFIF